MARREGFKGVVDLILVTGADGAIVHDLAEAVACLLCCDSGNVGLADCEEVRAETADEPFEEDLEDCGGDEGVEEADDGIVHVPEGADSDLADQDDCDGHEGAEESGGPDGDDFFAHWVCELWVDDLAVLEEDWEGTRRCGMSFVDPKADYAHDCHGYDVKPCHLEPLAEAWLLGHVHDDRTSLFVLMPWCCLRGICAIPLISLEEVHTCRD